MIGENAASRDEVLFLHLVSLFQAAAMQHLGKFVDPASGEARRELDQAKMAIDTLDMLKTKTNGNLTDAEKEFLDKVVFELHMNYVEEVKRSEDEGNETAPEERDDEGVKEDGTNREDKESEP